MERYEKAKSRIEELRNIKTERQAQADAIGAFMFEVQELDTLSEFDEKLWLTVIDTVTVYADGRMTFKFQGGTEIDAYAKKHKGRRFNRLRSFLSQGKPPCCPRLTLTLAEVL